jgi:hypothetical protein
VNETPQALGCDLPDGIVRPNAKSPGKKTRLVRRCRAEKPGYVENAERQRFSLL